MRNASELERRIPAYIRLYERLKGEIIGGSYPFGGKLPSKREMAAWAGVSVVTVEHAYALLCDEGYAKSRQRSGYTVIFRPSDGFAATSNPVVPLPPAPSGESRQVFPFSVLAKVMRRILSDYGEAILEKSPNPGCAELREAIRQYLARNRGIHVDSGQIIIGSGAEYLYSLIVGVLGRDRVYGLESPSYEKIEQSYRLSGAVCERLALGSDGIRSDALAATSASVLHLTPFRSYPTGITASASKRHEYIRWAGNPGRFLVEDDFESEFSLSGKPQETLFALSDRGNVIYLNTFSKTISPSLRMGYMVLPECLTEPFSAKLGNISCTVPTFEQLVLAQLIAEGDFERYINRVRRAMRREKS